MADTSTSVVPVRNVGWLDGRDLRARRVECRNGDRTEHVEILDKAVAAEAHRFGVLAKCGMPLR
jgi:hypothetical protein